MGRRGEALRISRHTSMPPMPGMLMSSSTASNGFGAHQRQRLFAARRFDNLKSKVSQNGSQREPNGALVIHNEQVARSVLIHWPFPPF
jgi:hypothetical protein